MSEWDRVRKIVGDVPPDEIDPDTGNKKWVSSLISDKKFLLKIVDQAEKWGLRAPSGSRLSISNLRAIVHKARIAIRESDKEELQRLLDSAATIPYKRIRHDHQSKRQDIIAQKIGMDEDIRYMMSLTQSQFDILKAIAVNHFNLIEW